MGRSGIRSSVSKCKTNHEVTIIRIPAQNAAAAFCRGSAQTSLRLLGQLPPLGCLQPNLALP